jgi:hypothetical protein
VSFVISGGGPHAAVQKTMERLGSMELELKPLPPAPEDERE